MHRLAQQQHAIIPSRDRSEPLVGHVTQQHRGGGRRPAGRTRFPALVASLASRSTRFRALTIVDLLCIRRSAWHASTMHGTTGDAATPPIKLTQLPLPHPLRRAGRNGGCWVRRWLFAALRPGANDCTAVVGLAACRGGGHISAAMACPRQRPLALALLLAAAASSQAALAAPPRPPAVAAAPAGASLTFLSVRNLDAALYGVGQGEKMRSSKNLGHHFQPTRSRGPKSPLTHFLGSPKRTGAGR